MGGALDDGGGQGFVAQPRGKLREHRRCWIALANKPSGIDIDGHECFGVINDDIAARFQPDLALQGAFDFFFNAKRLKQRHRLLIEDEVCCQMG